MSTGLIVAIVGSVLLFAGGVACIVRYARTRKLPLLLAGLLLMFVLPAIILLFALGVFTPSSMVTYGPSEDFVP